MSSNTLRGIGREGEGDGEGRDAPKPAGGGEAAEKAGGPRGGRGAESETNRDSAARGDDLARSSADASKAQALDTPVPGTRSLDASVPEAQPSLDAKVPGLAATLLGVRAPELGFEATASRRAAPGSPGMVDAPSPRFAAPSERTTAPANVGPHASSAGGRDKGTAVGRDIHLHVEAQALAGVRPGVGIVIGDSGATPELIDRSEPTLADPVKTAAIAQATVDHALSQHADLNSHAPWYDQEPAGAHVYEDEKASFVGRAAIGVAIAAGVSVVLFAIVRLYAQSGATEEAETPRSALSYKSATLPAQLPPAPSGRPSLREPTPTLAEPSTTEGSRMVTPPSLPANASRHAEASGLQGDRPNMLSHTTRPPVRVGVVPQSLGSTPHGLPTPRPGWSTQTPSPAVAPALPPTTPPPITSTLPTVISASGTAKSSMDPTTASPARAAPARAKTNYDPDSTLPLNVE